LRCESAGGDLRATASCEVGDYNERIIDECRANAGKVGGRWEGRDLLLLTTKGRKTGREYTTPIVFTRQGAPSARLCVAGRHTDRS
jgi:F420H(2)-dependent quinone reductase